jgi:cyclohexanone monooxygenase
MAASTPRNFNDIVIGKPFEVDLVSDGWTEIFRNLKTMAPLAEGADETPEAELMAEIADFQK